MSSKKIEFKYFDIMDYEKEAEYLRRMHRSGWALDHIVFPGIYYFHPCAPEEMVYQLDYNPEGSAEKESYVRMFEDCGWEYLMDFVGYSYFRRPGNDPSDEAGIFCDDSSRIDMLRRIIHHRLLPLLVIFCAILIPQMVTQLLRENRLGPLTISYGILIVLYLILFFRIGVKYRRFRDRLNS